jgi:hypothetical protein
LLPWCKNKRAASKSKPLANWFPFSGKHGQIINGPVDSTKLQDVNLRRLDLRQLRVPLLVLPPQVLQVQVEQQRLLLVQRLREPSLQQEQPTREL